jgi:hypothetical protein
MERACLFVTVLLFVFNSHSSPSLAGENEALVPNASDVVDEEYRNFYSDIELLWFNLERPGDQVVEYDLAPRFILGYDETVGVRARYWLYDHHAFWRADAPPVRVDFDVVDLEATTHARFYSSDILLSGGARIAELRVFDPGFEAGAGRSTQGGLTFAAEGRTELATSLGIFYGARLSSVVGDWHGQFGDPLYVRSQYANYNSRTDVQELRAGVEFKKDHIVVRGAYELQSWESATLRRLMAPEGFSFQGVGFDVGWSY